MSILRVSSLNGNSRVERARSNPEDRGEPANGIERIAVMRQMYAAGRLRAKKTPQVSTLRRSRSGLRQNNAPQPYNMR